MRAVIFDFDGVVIDSEYLLASLVLDALARRGAAVGLEEIAPFFGSTESDDEWEALLAFHLGDTLTLAQLEAELDGPTRAGVDALPLMPGVAELLEAFRSAGWRVGLATGTNRSRLAEHLERLNLVEMFDAVVTRSEVSAGKPSPDIFLEAAARLGVPPDACVVIEDSVPGVRAATAAGMQVVLCPSRATAGCTFPDDVRRVATLLDVEVATLLAAEA